MSGDGRPDIVTANVGSGSVTVMVDTTFLGSFTANFSVQLPLSAAAGARSVSLADLNGDGQLDIVTANETAQSIAVIRNTTAIGSGFVAFAAAQTFATGTNPETAVVADLNGDGRPDVAVSNFNGSTIGVLMNETAPGATTFGFAPSQTFSTPGGKNAGLAAADFSQDGRLDLVSTPYTGSASSGIVLLNNMVPGSTTANFSSLFTFPTSTGSFTTALAVGDLNGDGKPDVVAANAGGNNLTVVMNTSTTSPQQVSINGSPATGTIQDDDAPVTITPVGLTTPQSAVKSTAFARDLSVLVENAVGDPVSNVSVTFAAPASGASGAFTGSATVLTNTNGIATAPTFTANATTGGYNVTATATGGSNPAATFALTNVTLDSQPAFTSANHATFFAGIQNSFNLTVSGTPTPTLSESGSDTLPSGIHLNANTGVLSGLASATSAGIYTLHFTAQNGVGSNATQTFTLTVSPFVQTGSTLTVEGTTGNDAFSISGSVATLSVTLNGVTNNYSPATISTVIYNGNGGSDTSTILGLQGTPITIFTPTLTTVNSVNYSYKINGSNTVYVYGAAGDTATMDDSAGNDSVLRLADLQRHGERRRQSDHLLRRGPWLRHRQRSFVGRFRQRQPVRLLRQRHVHVRLRPAARWPATATRSMPPVSTSPTASSLPAERTRPTSVPTPRPPTTSMARPPTRSTFRLGRQRHFLRRAEIQLQHPGRPGLL